MKKLALLLVVAIAVPASANMVVNGDWSTGDETGWTQWNAPWGPGVTWSVDLGDGNPAPAGKLVTSNSSFGWYQAITVVPGNSYTITADWKGTNIGWIEVLFFNDDGRSVYDQLDAPLAGSLIAKRDAGGLGGGPNFGWQSILNSQQNPNTIVATGTTMYVGLKVGAVPGYGGPDATGLFDNIVVTPEPATMLLLGLPALFLRRRRA